MDSLFAFSRHDITEKLYSILKKQDILFIVPPVATTKSPILGPLILQQLSRDHQFTAEVLHLNLLLASILGIELYESISFSQPFRLLGERLFARAAHGLPALGNNRQLCFEPMQSVYGKEKSPLLNTFEYKFYAGPPFELDLFLRIEEVCFLLIEITADVIASIGYKIIGCSSNWEQNNCSVALINKIKQLDQQTITLIGGYNCEGEMARGIALLSDCIDYIFSGEGEEIFTAFLTALREGKLPEQQILKGKPVKNMDSIPRPDLSSYTAQRECFFTDHAPGKWGIAYESSRGCYWGKCDFCGLNGQERPAFRQKSAARVIADIKSFYRHYPDQSIAMTDKVMPPAYQETLLPLLQQCKTPALSYEQRPDMPLKELLELKKAGFIYIKPGVEALSQGLLHLMNKGVTIKDNLLLLRHCACTGLYVDWNLLWAFPNDKAQYYEETLALIPLLYHLCPPSVFRHISLDRFSPYFQDPARFGINNLRPWAAYQSVYPGHIDLAQAAYRFIGDYDSQVWEQPALINDIAVKLEQWKANWRSAKLVLHPLMGQYMIVDNRENLEKPITYLIDNKKAKKIMVFSNFEGSAAHKWAVEHKLAVIKNNIYIPLITASPTLILEFESIDKREPVPEKKC